MGTDSKAALLLIDIQQAMFGPDEICHEPERVLANATNLLARARAARVPVFHIQHCEDEGAPLPTRAPVGRSAPRSRRAPASR
jgi:nicotinamidase-related amidase